MQTERWAASMARDKLTAEAKAKKAADRETTLTRLGGRNGHCYSQREVAKALGVTHQRVEQIERNALRKVKAFLEAKGALP